MAVILGRLPFIAPFISDPFFFKRCLVVHVDLALVVWFYALLAGLISLRAPVIPPSMERLSWFLSVAGVASMMAGAFIPSAKPILANYIPVIDHFLFLGGLGLFAAGILLYYLLTLTPTRQPLAAGLPADAACGLQAAAVAVILAGVTWISSRFGLHTVPGREVFFEFVTWGPGHVLQVANVCAMLAVWLWLIHRATGKALLSVNQSRILFTILVAPHFITPLLTFQGTMHQTYHLGATLLMRWGIFPVVLTLLGITFRHLRRYRQTRTGNKAAAAATALYASAGLTLLGFLLGAMIRGSTTLVPAHYHASLGGVTLAFMGAVYLLLGSRSTSPSHPVFTYWIQARRQIMLFGAGQGVFAIGFAIGGLHGLGRKTYASEQLLQNPGQWTGITVMALGGLAATVGGLWFLALSIGQLLSRWKAHPASLFRLHSLNKLPQSP